MPNFPLNAGTLPYNCWPADPQTFLNDLASITVALGPSTSNAIVGPQDSEPAITDRDKAWIRTSGGVPVFPLIWTFYNGQWVSKFPIPAGTPWALPYTGSLASIDTLDGGSAGIVSINTGPFWEVVASLAARIPVGAGTLPSGLILNPGDTGGEETHELLINELPPFQVSTKFYGASADGDNKNVLGGDLLSNEASGAGSIAQTNILSDSTGGNATTLLADGHNTMPPYTVLNFLRRTARQLCTQPIS